MENTNALKGFKKVKLKGDNYKYSIYSVYNEKELSLCIKGYDDVEQDFLTNIKEIERGFK
jgi:hypothetical protein